MKDCKLHAPCILLLRRSEFLLEDEEGERQTGGKWLRRIRDEMMSFHHDGKMRACKKVVVVASADDAEKLSSQTRQLFTHEVEVKRPGDQEREMLIDSLLDLSANAEGSLSAKVSTSD